MAHEIDLCAGARGESCAGPLSSAPNIRRLLHLPGIQSIPVERLRITLEHNLFRIEDGRFVSLAKPFAGREFPPKSVIVVTDGGLNWQREGEAAPFVLKEGTILATPESEYCSRLVNVADEDMLGPADQRVGLIVLPDEEFSVLINIAKMRRADWAKLREAGPPPRPTASKVPFPVQSVLSWLGAWGAK
ncbi:MAG: hypothetical protein WC901_01345 [Candidatus Margulisiibacteriota bacterium]